MAQATKPASVAIVAGIAAMAAGVAWISVGRAPAEENVGARPAASVVAPLPAQAALAPPPVRDAIPTPVIPPDRIAIPAIGLEAKVIAVGMDADRAVAVPEDIGTVGWFSLGVAPGTSHGSAVLVAHRDGRTQGRGAFFGIGWLQVGDRITVGDRAGRSRTYRVQAREYIRKAKLPLDELFATDGPPRLTLISCGGPYVKERGGYQDNVVVTATPA